MKLKHGVNNLWKKMSGLEQPKGQLLTFFYKGKTLITINHSDAVSYKHSCQQPLEIRVMVKGKALKYSMKLFKSQNSEPECKYLSKSSIFCILNSSEGTILSICWGSHMVALSSSLTVLRTTPWIPLIPAIRILGGRGRKKKKVSTG